MKRTRQSLSTEVGALLKAHRELLQPNFEDEYLMALRALLAGSIDAVTLRRADQSSPIVGEWRPARLPE